MWPGSIIISLVSWPWWVDHGQTMKYGQPFDEIFISEIRINKEIYHSLNFWWLKSNTLLWCNNSQHQALTMSWPWNMVNNLISQISNVFSEIRHKLYKMKFGIKTDYTESVHYRFIQLLQFQAWPWSDHETWSTIRLSCHTVCNTSNDRDNTKFLRLI